MRCTKHRDRRQDYTGVSLTLEEHQEWLACYFECVARNPQLCRKPREHACTSECTFWQHRNYYVCIENGHEHLCNELACDRQETRDEHRACTLTGLTYDLPFEETYDRGGGRSNEQHMAAEATDARTLATPSGKLFRSKKRGGVDGLSCNTPTPSPSPITPMLLSPTPSPQPPALLRVAPEQERFDVENLVRRLMQQRASSQLVDVVSKHILDAWQRIRLSSWWTVDDAKSYTLDQHILTHLYAMRGRTEDELYNGQVLVKAWSSSVLDLVPPLKQQSFELVSYKARQTMRETTRRLIGYLKRVIDDKANRMVE